MIKHIAISPGNSHMLGNRALDINYMSQISPEYTFMANLAKALQRVGYECMTSDVFLRTRPAERALLISYCGWGYWRKRKEFIPAICYCLESPIVVWYFFRSLPWIANRFEHVFLWPGARKRLHGSSAKFHDIFWPNSSPQNGQYKSWSRRKFLVMINSNKRAFQPNWDLMKVRSPLKAMAWSAYYMVGQAVKHTDPWMNSELYKERLEAIGYFSSDPGFDLFGRGWDKPVPGFEKIIREAVKKCYRREIPAGEISKLKVLEKYKFSLCFENTSFSGYITEKMFDCFFAGTIPIYLGAPDITDHVPQQSFIDFRHFKSYQELNRFIGLMSYEEASSYHEAAKAFMASPKFHKFRTDNLINEMILCLE